MVFRVRDRGIISSNNSTLASLEDLLKVSATWRERLSGVQFRWIRMPHRKIRFGTSRSARRFGSRMSLARSMRSLVSWMRSRDLHILTSGNFAFSSDARFGPQHSPGSDAWTLRLDNARKTDSGKYECQVNTEPKIMYAVQLSVRDPDKPEGYDEPHSQQTRISYESTAPVADIMGPREQRVPPGSTITLRCVILSPYQTRPIRGVQWLRDNKLLTFQAARGGINVETERGAARTVSVLTLAAVTQDDVGNYSCRPTEGRSATVTLVVEEGERTEAMQRDAGYVSSGSDVRHWPELLLPFSWLLILARNSQTFLL